jgi:hypothetical protein
MTNEVMDGLIRGLAVLPRWHVRKATGF